MSQITITTELEFEHWIDRILIFQYY